MKRAGRACSILNIKCHQEGKVLWMSWKGTCSKTVTRKVWMIALVWVWHFLVFLQLTPPSQNNMMPLRFFEPSNMQYQSYLSASPPPPPPYQFMSPLSQHHRELRHFPVESTPESEESQSDDTTTSATAFGSRMMWDNDDTDILVQCWAEVQRRYKAMPKTKLGKRKVHKPRGTELWREIT